MLKQKLIGEYLCKTYLIIFRATNNVFKNIAHSAKVSPVKAQKGSPSPKPKGSERSKRLIDMILESDFRG